MRPSSNQRGSALLMSMIVVMVIAAFGVAIVRFSSREVAGATAGRKEAAVTACAEAARALLMSQWKLLGVHGVSVRPLDVTLESASNTHIQGGHYDQTPGDPANWTASSQTWIKNVQVIRLDPLTVGSSYQVNDLTNRVADSIQSYRVVVHCTQGDGRQAEVEFAVQYGL
jgi:Tfp pilus assembly protein PilX